MLWGLTISTLISPTLCTNSSLSCIARAFRLFPLFSTSFAHSTPTRGIFLASLHIVRSFGSTVPRRWFISLCSRLSYGCFDFSISFFTDRLFPIWSLLSCPRRWLFTNALFAGCFRFISCSFRVRCMSGFFRLSFSGGFGNAVIFIDLIVRCFSSFEQPFSRILHDERTLCWWYHWFNILRILYPFEKWPCDG